MFLHVPNAVAGRDVARGANVAAELIRAMVESREVESGSVRGAGDGGVNDMVWS